MAEGVMILATLIWGGGLYLTFTGRMLLGALTAVAAWTVWLVFGITTHNQVTAIVAAVSLAVSLASFWFWKGRGRRRRGARAEIGDESRQLRDGLVRRMRSLRRKRPITRPEPQRAPS
jgi:membrane protein implicated in regulation of membrane protease activity